MECMLLFAQKCAEARDVASHNHTIHRIVVKAVSPGNGSVALERRTYDLFITAKRYV
jgi:hypothetical protein